MLWLRGDDVMPLTRQVLSASPDIGELEIVLEARFHAKVELSHDPELADSFWAVDDDDRRVNMFDIGPGGMTELHDANLQEGRSATLGIPDRASTLVFAKGGEEVRRIPLSLVPGRLNVITP